MIRGNVPPLDVPEKDDESYKLVNILNNPTLIPIFQIIKKTELTGKAQRMLTTLGKHIEEIITYIFEDSPTPLGTRCYLALQSSEDNLMKQLIEKGLLQGPAIKLVSQEKPPMLQICRLAGVTLATVICRPKAISQSCGYIFQLLEFINEPPIFDFFFQLISNENLSDAQNWLVSVQFETVVENQIKATPIDDLRLKYLFRLCVITKFSPIIYPRFTRARLISQLIGKITTLYENERWEALLALYSDETKEYIGSLFPIIIQRLKEPYKVFTKFHLASLGILTKIVMLDPGLGAFIAPSDLSLIILHMINTFPNHSFMFTGIERFLRAAFKISEIATVLVPTVLPVCMKAAKERKYITLTAFSMRIVDIVKKFCFQEPFLREIVAHIPGFRQFVSRELAQYIELLKNDYGGDSTGMQATPVTV